MIPLLLFALLPHISLIEGNPELFNGKYSFTESLTPYIRRHGSRLSHRSIRDCHQEMYGSPPHELFVAHQSNNSLPLIIHKRFVKAIPSPSFSPRTIRGHYIVVPDPLRTLSVLEPDQPGGCKLKIRQTVAETSAKHNCVVSLNAGYFNTKDGSCLGNVISDGRRAQDSNGVQNVHFGLTEDGQIFVGYLSKEQFLSENFKQLVGGVVWILRNGSDFVNDSKKMECEDTEETGPMERFVNILSARSVVGHDKNGNIILLQVDGKSEVDGINLYEMQSLLKEFGFVNAVNLDGGGSSSLVMHGVTANYPYDECVGEHFACDRKVSTILCVHPPYCEPNDCSEHGECSMGECVCQKNWLPPKCDKLFCGQNNCSENGVCTSEGCVCYPGYFGDDCNKSCSDGWFGKMCTELCKCKNSDGCDPVTGKCTCKPGFTGSTCEMSCPQGFFGPKCKFKCHCENSCYCDPVTGECNISHNSSLYYASVCLAKNIIQKQHLVKDNVEERRKWYVCIIVLGVITSLCLASFLLVMFCSCSCSCRNEQVLCNRRRRYRKYPLQMPSGELSASSSEDEFKSFPLKNLQKN